MLLRRLFIFAIIALLTACPGGDDDSPSNGDEPDAGADDVLDDTDDVDDEQPVELELDSVAPDEGDLAGGTTVTLGGQGFVDGMTVWFGDEESPQVTRQGGLSAQAESPPSSEAITVDVTVENPDGSSATLADAFTYVEEDIVNNGQNIDDPEFVEGCKIQFPLLAESLNFADDDDVVVYAVVEEPGVTDQDELPADFVGQALVGPAGADPTVDPGLFIAIDAVENEEFAGDPAFAEFQTTIPLDEGGNDNEAITESGTYAYVYHFSLDGGENWRYCDLDGSVDGDEVVPERFGALNVFDEAPDAVHFCQTWPDELVGAAGEEGPTMEMEIYEAGITDTGDVDDTLLEVEAGLGPVGTNPALGYSWTALEYQDQVTGNENNSQFGGPLYDAADSPDQGSYQAITRVRLDGAERWSYCNTDPNQPDFFFDVVTSVTIAP